MVRQHVSPEELYAFALEREPLSSTARQHFAGCLDCQQEVAALRQTSARLVSQLYRRRCPSATTLSYYCLPNALTEAEQRRVADHLTNCPLCLAEFATTRQFLDIPV